jgi:hypothetical protein
MADTTVTSSLQEIQFRKDFFKEYIRDNRLRSYSGKGVDKPFCVKMGREPTIRHPLVTRLLGDGVSGSQQLRGSGEAIGNYAWDTNPTYYRHAVEFNKEDAEKTNIDLMRAARPLLMDWAKAETRDRMIEALGAVYNGTTYAKWSGTGWTEGITDTWQANNSDRIYIGAGITLTGDMSTDLAGVDGTNDKLTGARVSSLRRTAEDADPHIRPIETDQESEVFVLFAGSIAFRDLKADLQTLNSNADVRGMKITKGGNILARDGDMFWDGVIIRKVPEITTIFSSTGKYFATAGALGVKVEPAFLCGAQAAVWGLGQEPDIVVDRDYDYGFRPGVAIELKEDIKKAFFNSKQHGMVSGFFSGVV